MSEHNLPIRVVEGEWRYDRRRHVEALPALDAPNNVAIPFLVFMSTLDVIFDPHLITQYALLGAPCVAYILWRRIKARRLVAALRADADTDRPDFVGIVRVTLRRGIDEYGADAGALYIDGHTLHFEGTQTMFSFPATHLGTYGRMIDRPEYYVEFHEIAKRWRSSLKLNFGSPEILARIAACTPDPDATEIVVTLPPLHPVPSKVTKIVRSRQLFGAIALLGSMTTIAGFVIGWKSDLGHAMVLFGIAAVFLFHLYRNEAGKRLARFRRWAEGP